MKFKVGDEVEEPKTKSIGWTIDFEKLGGRSNFTAPFIITKIHECGTEIRVNNSIYSIEDLVLKKGEKDMKYEWTGKELTIGDVIAQSRITMTEISRLALWFNEQYINDSQVHNKTNIFINENFIEYATQHKCFKDFLLKEGYIKEKKEEVFYKVGDRFNSNGIAMIIKESPGSGVVTKLNCDSNFVHSHRVEVLSPTKITKKELLGLGLYPNELIKDD